jgi:hypothetical protein
MLAQSCFLVLGLSVSFFGVKAQDEVTIAKDELRRQIELCEQVDYYLESIDRGRLKILREASAVTLDSVEKFGLGNMTTMNFFQLQIITYRYSERFFKAIESDVALDSINELRTIAEKIERDRGGPFLKITNYIFVNLEKHFRELRRLVDGQGLASKLDGMNLWPEFGNVIAISATGDKPNRPFCEAVALYLKIRSLYADLDHVSSANPIFDASQSIIGLTEFYREYAEPDMAHCE